jgi:hypothetical protein
LHLLLQLAILGVVDLVAEALLRARRSHAAFDDLGYALTNAYGIGAPSGGHRDHSTESESEEGFSSARQKKTILIGLADHNLSGVKSHGYLPLAAGMR